MAETPIRNDVFKFVALRPPAKVKTEPTRPGRIADPREPNDTAVGEIVNELGDDADI
ncbi:MAG: hypothetical protein IIA23_11825, partial [Chloroflexi bacterium]|nr:hypothetical protein [Chloroflexota bacterium]